jgi:pimeloyl-[acyl-carrier protein] methyl ester esterase
MFLHGWGYGPWVWPDWAAAFPERPVVLLDAGYFGPEALAIPDNPDGWVGVGHSQGFARLLGLDVPWRGLIGFGAFLRFCRLPGRESGTPPELLDAMLARLDTDPADVLRRFTRRCGQEARCRAPLDEAGLQRLREGLRSLQRLELAAPRHAAPTLLAHAADDRIVPLALAQEACDRLPGARLSVFDTGGHVLPFARTADCIQLVREFLHGLE